MRIEELVLEGFKSYPVRTQITGWDPSFNAITGLNGSGKSNILDAICFVLGLTNLSQVRATNQQDLIYKRGQAGVTKASVTVVFDNSDRSTSPVGFENLPQITVTRQIALPNISKYLLNGHKTQQQTVQNLFQSVQLNINNPNFLIMQGRITKVLNMKPQEILGMVEEAAGTRMFEERKDKAKKTMDKKQKKIDEIQTDLNNEIIPKLDKLRLEKRSFLSYQKACTELEKLSRVLRAWEWKEANERVRRKDAELEKKGAEMDKVQEQREKRVKEGDAAERDRKDAEKRRDAELKKGGKFAAREGEVKQLEKELVKLRTQAEIKHASIQDEEKKVRELEQNLATMQQSLVEKRTNVETVQKLHAKLKQEHTAAQEKLANAEELLQTLLTGLSTASANTSGGGYLGQLADAKQRLSQAKGEEEQARRKLGVREKECAALEAKWKAVERDAAEGSKTLQKAQKELDGMKAQLQAMGLDPEEMAAKDSALAQAKERVRSLTDQRDRARQQVSAIDFSYADPTPNFDRSKVKGVVASLISLPPEDHSKSTALEIAAGAKLYNVVVENEQVGKQLIENGRLKKRVTIIPLNKINAFRASAAKLNAANKAAPGRARLALSLIGFDDEVANAMAYVFGDTIICDDAEAAKAVTFNPAVGMKSVTLAGDVYDPSGTLSGGSAPSSSGLLIRAQEVRNMELALREARDTLGRLQREEETGRAGREQFKARMRELELKEHEVRLLQQQLEGSNASRVGAEYEALKKTIVELQQEVEDAKNRQKEAEQECKKLEQDMDEFKNNKDGKITELKGDISKYKANVAKHSLKVKTQSKDLQEATLELEQLEREIESCAKDVQDGKAGAAKIKSELDEVAKQLTDVEKAHERADRKLQEERATLTRFDNELKELEQVIDAKKQAVADADLQLKKIEHETQNVHKDRTAAANAVVALEKQNPWISEEKKLFGKQGSAYDFEQVNIQQSKEKAKELEEQQKGMKKKINPKVLNMIDSVEKKEAALKKMMATVLRDKDKIEETIEELDRYKRDALHNTWKKVNADFGDIFAELLPGNFAKLQPPEGRDLTEGLEVKVQLGTVWKESLTELSGGQRSLIALSLIMSLLQFKPAPMYILDEIDAALDLSHTQHIGTLFRTRFKGSQFIVVSLKEGLFTNANVLFRARFRDGTSIVERTAQRSTSSLYDSTNKENDDDSPAGRRRRARG
ncbi:condensin complex subunit SMC2 [Exidia glandulosa HHB12029]|uniref:Structural maintenance of chromosomes protein n=1 Tax=Exidia glandulosa HHB12029 TaxID=1314781 RepID=A0A165EVJ4_EXIGL|nr:condensin complex subunit SMC2 [Exidia glandulosa HHB12029]